MVEQDARTSSLDLELKPRDFIRIDGATYDVIPMASLSIRGRTKLQRDAERVTALEQLGENATDDDETEYRFRLMNIAMTALPDAPSEIIEKLDLGQLQAVVATFLDTSAASPEYQALSRSMRRTRLRTASPTSPPSTEPGSGSSTPPLRSSTSSPRVLTE